MMCVPEEAAFEERPGSIHSIRQRTLQHADARRSVGNYRRPDYSRDVSAYRIAKLISPARSETFSFYIRWQR